MSLEIREEPPSALTESSRVPIAFEVRERLAIAAPDAGLGGLRLVAERVEPPFWKDYDALPENHPTTWARRFDPVGWGIHAAYSGAERVGGAVIVCGAAGVEMLEGRADLAVLWDLRVAPEWQGQGIGAALFGAVERWAVERGASCLKVETQNINVLRAASMRGRGAFSGRSTASRTLRSRTKCNSCGTNGCVPAWMPADRAEKATSPRSCFPHSAEGDARGLAPYS